MDVKVLSGALQTERLANGKRILLRDFEIEVNGRKYSIPSAGFTTDYSSIPWYGRFVVRWSKVDIAGVVHDYLYKTGLENRKYSDQVWRGVAQAGEHSANRLQAGICYLSLRIGGGPAWRRYRTLD